MDKKKHKQLKTLGQYTEPTPPETEQGSTTDEKVERIIKEADVPEDHKESLWSKQAATVTARMGMANGLKQSGEVTTSEAHGIKDVVADYLADRDITPLFLLGSCEALLGELSDGTFDCVMTSPPYWGQREYAGGGIGLEETPEEFVDHLLDVTAKVYRTLKDTGSFWLNIGDTYINKGLGGIPWRLTLAMIDKQGWVLRNDVIWNKLKGPDTSKDKLRNVHEYVFHFVKKPRGFYYNVDAIRSKPRKTKIINGAIVSGTGVSGVKYKRQIELSTALTPEERANAFAALETTLAKLSTGELHDFRMVIRGQQRTTHSDSTKVSGRAKELEQKGFYILRYHPNGSKPADVWEIIPEDTTNRGAHYAPFPEDLCKIPILATCPVNGLFLDPFCGTGTANLVAQQLGRKSVGMDLSDLYINIASDRCRRLL